MLNIDTETFLIELTRGDNAVIQFGANYSDDQPYYPTTGDVLRFAVAKARNKTPLFQITNDYGVFSAEAVTQTEFEADKTKYFTYSGGVYTRCSENSVYDAGETYYVSLFWDISILPEHTAGLKSGDYVWDLQLTTDGETYTVIGETDEIDPIFKIWGEVAEKVEGE